VVTTATPFSSILCGVEGDRAGTVATQQAITLAPGATLNFVAVSTTRRIRKHSRDALRESLEQAARLALEEGISVTSNLANGAHAINVLLPESERHDLLVIGIQDRSRRAGIVLDSTASRAAHETRGPLLIAREPPGEEFPKHILLALDGSAGSWAPAEAAAEIAAAFDSKLEVVHVSERADRHRQGALEAQISRIADMVGREPELTEVGGHASHTIVETAEAKRPSLLVCGRRGLHGLRALGSVSERLVHRAPCSVLLVPAGRRDRPDRDR
jgi:nucleotide-binding universal stress UspA family protein